MNPTLVYEGSRLNCLDRLIMEELKVPKSAFVFSLWGELSHTYTGLGVIGTGLRLSWRHKLTQQLKSD
jgi:hypothetical protein